MAEDVAGSIFVLVSPSPLSHSPVQGGEAVLWKGARGISSLSEPVGRSTNRGTTLEMVEVVSGDEGSIPVRPVSPAVLLGNISRASGQSSSSTLVTVVCSVPPVVLGRLLSPSPSTLVSSAMAPACRLVVTSSAVVAWVASVVENVVVAMVCERVVGTAVGSAVVGRVAKGTSVLAGTGGVVLTDTSVYGSVGVARTVGVTVSDCLVAGGVAVGGFNLRW